MRQTTTLILCVILTLSGFSQISFSNQFGLIPAIAGNSAEPCALDMNGDYLDDIVRVSGNELVISFQNGDGTYTTQNFPVNFQNTASWSIVGGDIDKNGYNDLIFGSGNRVSFIYAADDGASYSELFIDDYIFAQRSTFSDIDNDGHLDAFVCHDVDLSNPYRNDGSGMLSEDNSLIATQPFGGNYAAVWVDYDNDSDMDLYITKCRGGAPAGDPQRINGLYRNDGPGNFTEVGTAAGMDSDDQSWSTVFEDFDNDGDFDAFIVNHAWANLFMDNNGDGTFTDIIAGTGIDATDLGAWESMGGDFDNDGFVDIFSEVGQGIYKNNGDGTFTDIDIQTGQGAVADLNDDGFLDIFTGNSIYINNQNANHWIKFGLQGIASNANGIGARLELYGSWGMQSRECRAGQGFSPGHTLNVHFGIGSATEIDSLMIHWPSGTTITIENPAIDQLHIVPEAECIVAPNEITVTGDLEICPGSSVTLTADPGYEYNWSNGDDENEIVVSQGGNYSVILTDVDGCISQSNSVTVSVIQDEIPMISTTSDDTNCAGTEVILMADGGDNWLWSTNENSQTISITETGDYWVQSEGLCQTMTSETISMTFVPLPADPVVDDITIPTAGNVMISATGENLVWYDDALGTNEIGTGGTLDIDVTETTTYYVQANSISGGELQDGGKLDNSGAGGLPSSGAHTFFTTTEPFTLLNVLVYVPAGAGASDRTITLNDEDGNVLETTVIFLDEGEHVIDLDYIVPVGTDLSLRCIENNLFRNNGGVTYPYPIGDVGEMTGSVFGDIYYYYFYDWKIQKEEMTCSSGLVPVTVSVTSINDIANVYGVTLLPNPVENELTISLTKENSENLFIEIFNATGQLIFSDVLQGSGQLKWYTDCSAWANGNYTLKLNDGQFNYNTNFIKM